MLAIAAGPRLRRGRRRSGRASGIRRWRAGDRGSQSEYGGRLLAIADDTLQNVLRREALGDSVEQILPALIIPTGKRKGQSTSVASVYWAPAEHAVQV